MMYTQEQDVIRITHPHQRRPPDRSLFQIEGPPHIFYSDLSRTLLPRALLDLTQVPNRHLHFRNLIYHLYWLSALFLKPRPQDLVPPRHLA
jgi:hypothetical protein